MTINLIRIKRITESRCLIDLSLVQNDVAVKVQYVHIEYMDDTNDVKLHANFSKVKISKKQKEEISNFCYSCMNDFLEKEESNEKVD